MADDVPEGHSTGILSLATRLLFGRRPVGGLVAVVVVPAAEETRPEPPLLRRRLRRRFDVLCGASGRGGRGRRRGRRQVLDVRRRRLVLSAEEAGDLSGDSTRLVQITIRLRLGAARKILG